MINYTESKSSFFIENQKICQTIENKLVELLYSFEGFCTSYGYEINAKKDNISLKFSKTTTSRDGVSIPIDSSIYFNNYLEINKLDKNIYFEFGNNIIWRFLMKSINKKNVPKPYYYFDNSKNVELLNFALNKNLNYFKIKNQKLVIHSKSNPLDLFECIPFLKLHTII